MHPLAVLGAFALAQTKDDVPVLRADQYRVQHLERHVQALERGRRTSAAADGNRRGRLAVDQRGGRETDTLPRRQERSGRLAVVGRRANHDRVGGLELLDDPVGHIVVERAAAEILSPALAAGDAAPDGLQADPEGFGLEAFRGERVSDFLQRPGRVAVGVGTSVDEQYFHFRLLFFEWDSCGHE